MKRYMPDTNTVSRLLRKHPDAKQLHLAVREFLLRVDVLPWESATAECCGIVRTEMARHDKVLAPLDMLIAVHALCVSAVLVTNDRAFGQMAHLPIEDWTE